MSTAKKTKPAKLSLRAQLKQIRDETAAAHEQAHVERLDACAQAVEEIVAPVLAGITGLDGDAGVPAEQIGEPGARAKPAKVKAERAPLTESECAAAGDAWIEAKDGRLARYGVVEASSGVVDGKCPLTTTNFHLLEVDAITGKVRYLGVSPLRPARPNRSKTDACTAAALQAEAENELGLTNMRGIAGHAAATYAQMLIAGPVTPRAVEQATGLTARERCRVDHALGKAGWKLHHKRNPDRVPGDRDTANLYWLERAGA